MEQVPHVAMYCHEEKDDHQWMHLVPSFLLPLVVRYLTDVNNQVGSRSFLRISCSALAIFFNY